MIANFSKSYVSKAINKNNEVIIHQMMTLKHCTTRIDTFEGYKQDITLYCKRK